MKLKAKKLQQKCQEKNNKKMRTEMKNKTYKKL
jgi:hypothetical protein